MSQDFDWMRKHQDYLRSRRAAQAPDEEPDDDQLAIGDSLRRESERQHEITKTTNDRRDRGLDYTPKLSDQ